MTPRQKSLTKLLTVCGIIFALIVVVALVFNVVTLVNLSKRRDALDAEVARLEQVVENNEDSIEYRGSEDYIERYAREYLNMIGKDDIANVSE